MTHLRKITLFSALLSVLALPLACGSEHSVRGVPNEGAASGGQSATTSSSTANTTGTDPEALGGQGGEESQGERAPTLVPATLIEAEDYYRALGASQVRQAGTACQTATGSQVPLSVDTKASGGCRVGATSAEQWIEFDVQATETANYDFVLSVKQNSADQLVMLQVDGRVRGKITESSLFDFKEVTLAGVGLSAGTHVVRITFESGENFLDYLKILKNGDCVPACEADGCGDDSCGNSCGSCDSGTHCSSGGQCLMDFGIPVEKYGQLSISGNQMVSASGQPVQLRGISTQWLNWEQSYSTNPAGLKFMRDEWGLEILRVANGVENSNGYLEESVRAERLLMIKSIIDSAVELGIYVLVDWHTHEIEHVDLAREFFAEIARSYGSLPNVLYEPFNEPVGPFDKFDGTGSEEAYWKDQLKPYHDAIVGEIRAIDPDNVIVLGTPQWSQSVNRAAADPVAGDNLAYTVHFYSCTHGSWLMDRVQAAMDAGIAIMATEWAATHSDGGTPDNPLPCIAEARDWHAFLDKQGISSTAWKLASDEDSSSILVGDPSPIGKWTTSDLSEHGQLVRELLQNR